MSSGVKSSTYSSLYASPEQPVVFTPNRTPKPLPRLDKYLVTWRAAAGVKDTAMMIDYRNSGESEHISGNADVFLFVVFNSCLDGILGQNRAMDFDRGQGQFLGDFAVLEGGGLVQGFTLDPLCDQRR